MSPQFTPMGGFVGGPTNTFGQMPTGAAPMPTGAAPTATSGANYSQINARASLNNNGFGRLCVGFSSSFFRHLLCLQLYWSVASISSALLSQMALSLGHSSLLEQQRQCGPSGKASSIHRVIQSRATSKTCFL